MPDKEQDWEYIAIYIFGIVILVALSIVCFVAAITT